MASAVYPPKSWNPDLFSRSVNALFNEIEGMTSGANLLQLIGILHNKHSEYGALTGSVSVTNSGHAINPIKDIKSFLDSYQSSISWNTRTAGEWASEALTIFKIPAGHRVLNGRIVLTASVLSEFENIRSQVTEQEVWANKCTAIIEKMSEELLYTNKIELKDWYTDRGNELIQRLNPDFIEHIANPENEHSSLLRTPNNNDNPAKEDKLSRFALAEHITKRIRFIYHRDIEEYQSGSFFVLIDGPWGSGKSTLLNFMERILTAETNNPKNKGKAYSDWVVVNFNAWEHQRLSPPWWYLMTAVYKAILRHTRQRKKKWSTALFLSIKEGWWRLNTGTNLLWATVFTLVLFLASLYWEIADEDTIKKLPIYQTGSLIVFLWSLSKLLRTSLISGSSKAAQEFIQEYGKDPMEKIARHFKKMVEGTNHPVALFIEDLDRCNKDYGILLMEGLHTIFKQAPLVFVIAADAKWLRTMYESQYTIFEKVIAGPGKPFGLIFLDKVFQMRIELPDISSEQKRIYWNSLLNKKKEEQKDEQKREAAEKTLNNIRNASTIEEQFNILDKIEDDQELHQKAREELLKSIYAN